MTRYTTPERIYSRIQEELKSWFSSGSLIDDLMFPVWTADCLDIFENTYRPIQDCCMDMCNHECELPCNFYLAREVWMTATYNKGPITSPFVYYYQTDCRITPNAPDTTGCDPCNTGYQCFPPSQTPTPVAVELPSLCGVDQQYVVTHKVMSQYSFTYTVSCMLKPGNFKTISRCHAQCPNLESAVLDTFDIVGNKLRTSFRTGTIYMAYYTTREADPETGYFMIPENDPFQKYLYHYLRYMIYQQLFDQCSGDQLQEVRLKLADAEKKKDEHYIDARNYTISSDVYGLERRIVRSYNRNNRFIIPGAATRRR